MDSARAQSRPIILETLDATSFRPFGYVLEDPHLGQSTLRLNGTSANQGTALKFADIIPLENMYHKAPDVSTVRPSINLFVCSPRTPIEDLNDVPNRLLPLPVLERHRFTTQTFVPIGLDPNSEEASYLVIVAGSRAIPGSTDDLPNIQNVRAFVARGSQAITYGCGVWHAPMIVLGAKPISFVAIQFVNGISKDDCEECEIGLMDSGIHIQLPRGRILRSNL